MSAINSIIDQANQMSSGKQNVQAIKSPKAEVASNIANNKLPRDLQIITNNAVSNILDNQIINLKSSLKNSAIASSMLAIAKSGVKDIEQILKRQKMLTLQVTESLHNKIELDSVVEEFQQLIKEIDRIADNTNFQNIKLIDGSLYYPAKIKTSAENGDLSAGSFASGDSIYSGSATTIAVGSIGDSILTPIDTYNESTTGINLSKISNNPAFTGKISGFKAKYVGNNLVDGEIKVGNFIYQAKNINTIFNSDTHITFNSKSLDGINIEDGGSFTVNLRANCFEIHNQLDADNFAIRLNAAFSSIEALQKRTIQNYTPTGTIYGTLGASATGDLSGSSFKLVSSDFSNLEMQDISVNAPVKYGREAVIKFQINGEIYRSGYDSSGAISALGTSLGKGTYYLFNEENFRNVLVFKYNSEVNLNLSTKTNAEAAEYALNKAFGTNRGDTGLTFEVGTDVSDIIEVQIKGVSSKFIFLNNYYSVQTPDISNKDAALETIDLIYNAEEYVAHVKAQISALESRFNYASASIRSSINSHDMAKGFLSEIDYDSNIIKQLKDLVKTNSKEAYNAQAQNLPETFSI